MLYNHGESVPSGSNGTVDSRGKATPPPDVERLIRSVGITPESFAAAGLSSSDCDRLFDAALAHSFGVDRLGQLETATRNANIASDNAALQPERRRQGSDGSEVPALDQARATLENIRSEVFRTITASLPSDRVAVAQRIVENRRHWDLPFQYLAVERTDSQRAALRAALNTAELAGRRHQPANEAATAIIAAEDRDPDVRAALANLDSGITSIRQAWNRRATTATVP